MFTASNRITRQISPIVAAGAVLAALALPASAAATTDATLAVSVVDGRLSIDSLSSTMPMHVRVLRTDENTIRVSELSGGTAQAGDRCLVVQDDDTVDCDVTGLTIEQVQFEGSPLGDSLEFEAGWSTPVIAYGWGGADALGGGIASDSLHGGNGSDTLRGAAGDDYLFGELGNDVVAGGAGADQVNGDSGADRVFGGLGRDTLRGGIGADSLFAKGDATAGRDVVIGGAGLDHASLDRNVDTASQTERLSF